MKDRFIVTITDIEGSKHFMLHQIVKKFIAYVAMFIIFVIISAFWFIKVLSNEVDELESKKRILSKNEYELNLKSDKLQNLINQKTEQFEMLQDKVASIEELIGLTPREEASMNRRLDEIKVSGMAQEKLFSLIPNGNVLSKRIITARFGWRQHPIKKMREFHPGIDLRAKIGTPIKAPANGVVKYAASHRRGYGKMIIIDHSFGFQTRYAHLNKFNVKTGQFVRKGELIGFTGNTGLSTGPHLHYEVRFIGRILDPLNFLKWTRNNFTEIFEKERYIGWQSLVNIITMGTKSPDTPSQTTKAQKPQL